MFVLVSADQGSLNFQDLEAQGTRPRILQCNVCLLEQGVTDCRQQAQPLPRGDLFTLQKQSRPYMQRLVERTAFESFRLIPGSAILLSARSRLSRLFSSSLTFLICKMGHVIALACSAVESIL